MGTRSLTYVYGDDGHPIVCMYRQFDGYPTGHGAELAQFLLGRKIVNGIPIGQIQKVSNGMGDLAAQMVYNFKKEHETGGIYLHAPDVGQDCWQEFEYHLYSNLIMIYNDNCKVPNSCIFNGTWEEFETYCSSEKYGEVELNQTFENSLVGQEVLKQELKNGIVTVVFEKQDGTDRVMKCTLSEDIVPALDTTAVKQKRVANPDILAVWDTEADGWRCFRFDSIKSIQYA